MTKGLIASNVVGQDPKHVAVSPVRAAGFRSRWIGFVNTGKLHGTDPLKAMEMMAIRDQHNVTSLNCQSLK
jgi:hypothetical protein